MATVMARSARAELLPAGIYQQYIDGAVRGKAA